MAMVMECGLLLCNMRATIGVTRGCKLRLERIGGKFRVPVAAGLTRRNGVSIAFRPLTTHIRATVVDTQEREDGSAAIQVPKVKAKAKLETNKNKEKNLKVTPRSLDFSKWYLDVIDAAELADYGPVRGTMVIRPYGYAIWEFIQSWLDARFKETGHSNMYFPQLIPYSFIEKEASHVEGFSPELALVTIGGGKELEERLVVRPTSETIVNHMFAQWIQSYRDLPLLINQWANVHRWEMRTRPFVRTLEFLWQEGHTAHISAEEAEEEALRMIEVYREFAYTQAAIPVVVGRKSRAETFAGAAITYTIEAMMGDRKALQAGTSHNLGQNFAKAFSTQYTDENNDLQYVWQTSWGMSTRMVGGIIMTHGDDTGLLFPPRVAPIQVVVVPIWKKEEQKADVMAAAEKTERILKAAGVRVKLDAAEQKTPGWKYNFWEMKGVPIRIEIGPRDVAENVVVVARRDVPGKDGKQFGVSMDEGSLVEFIQKRLEDVQESLLARATAFRDSNIVDVGSYKELEAAIQEGKWARGPWAASDEDEARVKEETGATISTISMAGDSTKGPLRHIVLLTVGKKEDVPEVVKTLSDMSKEIVRGKHVSWINFDINSDLGIGSGNADVGLVIDFPDEENFKIYQKHDLHVAAITHNKKFVVSRTAIQIPLPKSSL